jgi:hypothetical protein
MAAKFQNENGWLLFSGDLHVGISMLPPIPCPMNFWEFNAMHPFIMGGNRKATVLINGHKAVVHGHSPLFLWPHIPLLPHPVNITFWLDVVCGRQKCWLPKGNVFFEGQPGAPTVLFCELSINTICFLFGPLPLSIVLQIGTVETTPTLGDYLSGLKTMAIDFAIGFVIYLTLGRLTKANPHGFQYGGNIFARRLTTPLGPAAQSASVFTGGALRTTAGSAIRQLANPVARGTAVRQLFGNPGGLGLARNALAVAKSPVIKQIGKGAWNMFGNDGRTFAADVTGLDVIRPPMDPVKTDPNRARPPTRGVVPPTSSLQSGTVTSGGGGP